MSDSEQTTAQLLREAAEQIRTLQAHIEHIESDGSADLAKLSLMIQGEQSAFGYMVRAFNIAVTATTETNSIIFGELMRALGKATRGSQMHELIGAVIASPRMPFKAVVEGTSVGLSDTDSGQAVIVDGLPVDLDALTANLNQNNKEMAGEALEADTLGQQTKEAEKKEVDSLVEALAVRANSLDDTEKQAGAATEDLQGK
ncbi:unnamed protein product [Zymoseptoria tritici ST99CH_1E4]|uniref:Uncharacterized protein n=2 Tax=Zymoseptoria tritici TaxID=1047171 RepID=F9XAU9_ZYMTI|nr:uncharacterized protein MYCGRDRAFT_93041 [Zymoseptoria tritici IPO323]EGP87709.1 hypothetical protein MYCGRDRAFT_93041 [Zymoseptoria tritici IPO323]SMR52389.1 unnamed protein product [Zymoseptoria tritici ST99CH_1E4]